MRSAPMPPSSHPADQQAGNGGSRDPERSEQCRQVLRLWLRWNEAHERLCEEMYQARRDMRALEDKLDQLDLLRQQAVRLSKALLAGGA